MKEVCICDAARVWGGPRATEPTEEARLLTDLTIPQPKEVAAYGLCGPAQAKQIMKEDKHTLTVTSSHWDLEEASFPVNSSVKAIGQCYRLHQSEASTTTETPRLTPRQSRTSIYRGLSSRQQHSPHPMIGG